MACRGPDHLYTKQRLQEIIGCSYKVAEELLAESKNDLNDAVEMYFAREGGKNLENVQDGGLENLDELAHYSDVKLEEKQMVDNSKGGSIVTTRPRLRKKVKDLNSNTLFQQIDAEEDMMQEVIAISLAEHYPHIDIGTIKYMVKQFKGRQDELMNYLEREAPHEQLFKESFVEGCCVDKMRSDSLEFDVIRGEFLRMTTSQANLKVCSIDIVRNKKLENNFEQEKAMMKSVGFSDLSSLLFPVKCPLDMEEVLENNFRMTVLEMGFYSTMIGVLFTETPKVPIVDMLPEEQSHLMMCLVLAGDSAIDREGNISVTSVNKILPKYVVHYRVERREVENRDYRGLDIQEENDDLMS